MISVETVINEFNGRFEASNYLGNVQTEKIGYDVFETVDEHQRQRARMILSALKGYDCEPDEYHYDPENNEILLEYKQKKYVAIVKLISVELSS